uniref:Uncharacterized protein n=1 Tax=Cacopsylla melanoneura TaxID=428564 RepID=A0A8D8QV26_9HEMI
MKALETFFIYKRMYLLHQCLLYITDLNSARVAKTSELKCLRLRALWEYNSAVFHQTERQSRTKETRVIIASKHCATQIEPQRVKNSNFNTCVLIHELCTLSRSTIA